MGVEDAVVYMGFAVNGSMRDYVFVGLHIGRNVAGPILLGRSNFGVLSVDPHSPDIFEIWDCDEGYLPCGMGEKRRYTVTQFRWSNAKGTPPVATESTAYSRDVYPGDVLYLGYGSMCVGNPKIRLTKISNPVP